jgi:hypothetical protein
MELKTSEIVSCEFMNEFKPKGTNNIVYYHRVELKNGDIGTVGTVEKMPNKIAVGTVINYDYDPDKMKIKLEQSMGDFATTGGGKQGSKQGGSKGGYRVKNQDEFLGYSWGYAKDLIIAGKTMKDVEELNKVARYIYAEMGKLLRNE